MIYPWQISQWQQLMNCKQQNRLPHAILLTGLPGVGKKHFAYSLAEVVLCENSDRTDAPCQTCHACHLIKAQNHPDLLIITPEQAGQAIKIDAIREVIQLVNETPQQGKYRVILIHPANAMNMHAANALLKTLEEPAPNTLFILTTDYSARIPATITSRCQKIFFQKPAPEIALSWLKTELKSSDVDYLLLLKLADGAPLKAKEIYDNGMMKIRQELYQGLHQLSQKQADPLQFAGQWQETDIHVFFQLLMSWLKDLMRFKLTPGSKEDSVDLINSDFHADFVALNQKLSQQNLLRFIEKVQQIYQAILRSINLNRQLMLEELFILWRQYVSS